MGHRLGTVVPTQTTAGAAPCGWVGGLCPLHTVSKAQQLASFCCWHVAWVFLQESQAQSSQDGLQQQELPLQSQSWAKAISASETSPARRGDSRRVAEGRRDGSVHTAMGEERKGDWGGSPLSAAGGQGAVLGQGNAEVMQRNVSSMGGRNQSAQHRR